MFYDIFTVIQVEAYVEGEKDTHTQCVCGGRREKMEKRQEEEW